MPLSAEGHINWAFAIRKIGQLLKKFRNRKLVDWRNLNQSLFSPLTFTLPFSTSSVCLIIVTIFFDFPRANAPPPWPCLRSPITPMSMTHHYRWQLFVIQATFRRGKCSCLLQRLLGSRDRHLYNDRCLAVWQTMTSKAYLYRYSHWRDVDVTDTRYLHHFMSFFKTK